ncbi:MAG: hypothetical protein QM698_11070 [Micropepsaceae bacterium]
MSDWDDLGELWRSNEPPELGDLRKRLRRQGFYIRAWFAHEIALALGASALGVWMMVKLDLVLLGAGVIAFAVFALGMSWTIWRGNFTVESGTPADAIAGALARNTALQRYIVANYIVSIAAVALIGLMVVTDTLGGMTQPERLERSLWAVTAGFGAMVLWLAGCGLYADRLRRERERLIALGHAMGVSGS